MYVHTDQGKLKPRALKGVFVGYLPGVKGYKIWLIDQKQCVISRNVQFQEQIMYKDIDNQASVTASHSMRQDNTEVEVIPDKVK